MQMKSTIEFSFFGLKPKPSRVKAHQSLYVKIFPRTSRSTLTVSRKCMKIIRVFISHRELLSIHISLKFGNGSDRVIIKKSKMPDSFNLLGDKAYNVISFLLAKRHHQTATQYSYTTNKIINKGDKKRNYGNV